MRTAGTGPMPKRSGSTPAVVYATKRASGAQAERLRPRSTHDQHRRGAVAHLRRVAGRDGAVRRGTRGAASASASGDVSLRGPSSTRTVNVAPPSAGFGAFASVDDTRSVTGRSRRRICRHRSPRGRAGGCASAKASCVVARDAGFARVVLGDEARRQVHVRVALDERRVRRHLVPPIGTRLIDSVPPARIASACPARDALGGLRDRLQPGRAESIHGHGRRR